MKEQQLKEEAFRDGLKILERTYGRYKAADTEVLIQLMLEVEKKIGGEDEAAFTQVIEEDRESNNVGQLHQEAMTTIRRMKVLLEIHQEKKKAAVAEVKEDPEFSHRIELESTMVSPESWKTPAEPEEAISGLS